MSKIITTKEASVKTVSIEIKIIQINNKQMTLSVFKQLKNESLINRRNGELNGIPWGLVNYHFSGGCSMLEEHIHVVWQKGNELRRSTIYKYIHSYKGDEDLTFEELQEKWIIQYQKLKKLDQLFIAV